MNHEVYLVALGEKIKSLRKDLGYSQEQFAEAINSNRGTVIRIESGTVNSTIGMLRVISAALKIELSDLVAV
jgi:transcriptional regulator with XRE-family HTH domain